MSDAAIRSWIDGRDTALVPVQDRGLQYGDGHFTTIACRDGALRFWSQHLQRLRIASERLHIDFTAWPELTEELAVAARAAPPEAMIKVIITRGDALARGYGATGRERARRIVSLWPTKFPTPQERGSGCCALVGEMRLGENAALAGLKHLNRLESIVARHEWTRREIVESLHATPDGLLVGGTMSNVFLMHGKDQFLTPDLSKAGVAGIVRSIVLRECAKLGVQCQPTSVSLASVWEADAVFVTNARLGVMPVTSLIDNNGRARRLAVPPVIAHLAEQVQALDA